MSSLLNFPLPSTVPDALPPFQRFFKIRRKRTPGYPTSLFSIQVLLLGFCMYCIWNQRRFFNISIVVRFVVWKTKIIYMDSFIFLNFFTQMNFTTWRHCWWGEQSSSPKPSVTANRWMISWLIPNLCFFLRNKSVVNYIPWSLFQPLFSTPLMMRWLIVIDDIK